MPKMHKIILVFSLSVAMLSVGGCHRLIGDYRYSSNYYGGSQGVYGPTYRSQRDYDLNRPAGRAYWRSPYSRAPY